MSADLPSDFFNRPLADVDPEIADVLAKELHRQQSTLEMIASENFVPEAVLECQGSVLTNKYAEGYPGRAITAGASSSTSPSSWPSTGPRRCSAPSMPTCSRTPGAQANTAVYHALLQPGDTLLGLSAGPRRPSHARHEDQRVGAPV